MDGKFIAYYRVSTECQGRSGLGLDAQKKAVLDYLGGNGWELTDEITEVETGKNAARPGLDKAFKLARVHGARVVIAKLDRLSRNAAFLLKLQDAGAPFVCADMPDANELTVGIMAVFAQAERKMVSKRTKDALAIAKARGIKMGAAAHRDPKANTARLKAGQAEAGRKGRAARSRLAAAHAQDMMDVINDIREAGIVSATAISNELNARSIPTPSGRGKWQATTVQRIIKRAAS